MRDGAFKENRLAIKMIVYLAPVAILPLLFALYSLTSYYSVVKNQSLEDNRTIGRLLMQQYDQNVQQLESVISQTAKSDILTTDNLFLKRELFNGVIRLHRDIEKVMLIGIDHSIVTMAPLNTEMEGKTFEDIFGYALPMPLDEPKMLAAANSPPTFFLVHSIGNGATNMYLVAQIKLNAWYAKTQETSVNKGVTIVVFGEGEKEKPLVVTSNINPRIMDFFTAQRRDAGDQWNSFDIDQEIFDGVYQKSSDSGRHILIAQSRDAALARPHRILFTYLAIMLVLVMVVGYAVTDLVRQGATVDAELQLAEVVQRAMLSNEVKMVEKTKLSFHYEPAKHLGGDWFYVFEEGSGRYIYALMGDITGHGLSQGIIGTALNGSLCMVEQLIRTTPQSFLPKASDLVRLIDRTLRSLSPDGKVTSTCLAVQFDMVSHSMYVCNAGHTFPILLKNKPGINIMNHLSKNQHGMLGLVDSHPEELVDTRYTVEPGDLLVIYTDGLTEARDSRQKTFKKSLQQVLKNVRDFNRPNTLKAQILKTLQAHTQGTSQDDDICFVIIQPLPLMTVENRRDLAA